RMDLVPAAVRSSLSRTTGAVLALGLAVVLVTAACSVPAEPTPPTAPPLTSTFDSPEALAQAVLTALASGDLERLRALALSEAEFRDHVWPELPTSRPERNVPFEYAWGQMKQRSDGHLQQTFSRYARRPLKFVRTRFTGETTTYATFSVMRESEIVATDDTGRDLVLRLYGSALVKDGRYKMFSFVVDE
ncbi:MAG TPA: hypothetical protein VFV51_02965, partial [Vicinamibacterales bacterium]|nr:hypothetical protein [Vicinamibacterales bacterium]